MDIDEPTPEEVERMLGGHGDLTDPVASFLADLDVAMSAPVPPSIRRRHLRRVAAVQTGRSPMRGRMGRVAVASLGLVVSTGGAAFAGALPAPVQRVAVDVGRMIHVSIPAPVVVPTPMVADPTPESNPAPVDLSVITPTTLVATPRRTPPQTTPPAPPAEVAPPNPTTPPAPQQWCGFGHQLERRCSPWDHGRWTPVPPVTPDRDPATPAWPSPTPGDGGWAPAPGTAWPSPPYDGFTTPDPRPPRWGGR